MDASVVQAMAKWPDVPAVFNWLELDRRGNWLIKGARIGNPAVVQFIGRNYACDATGKWFFQNGPQRVYVRLEYTPILLRTEASDSADGDVYFVSHTGVPVRGINGAWLDEDGNLLLRTELGAGLVDDRDLAPVLAHLVDASGRQVDESIFGVQPPDFGPKVADAVLAYLNLPGQRLAVTSIVRAQAGVRLGFVPDPHPQAGEPEC